MNLIDDMVCRSVNGHTTDIEEQQLLEWRRVSEANDEYYHQLVGLLDMARAASFVASAAPSGRDLIDLAEAETPPGRGTRGERFLGGWTVGVGLAAALALVVLGSQLFRTPREPEYRLGAGEFVTGLTETATITLGDGTVVRMAPRSRLRVAEAPNRRQVHLTGKAYFSVARHERYPFTVRTRSGDVAALGTRFEVRAEEDVRVVVAEGRVAVQGTGGRVELRAGEMSMLVDDAPSPPVRVDVTPILAWVGNFLAFQETPLRQVAAELEKEYDARVVVASNIDTLTITGWYVDRSLEEVITIICGVLGVPCSVQNGTALIGSPSTNGR